ncbi:DUF4432 family protein [Nonomuraea sp. NPDC052265]|uniref:DUF4432 family protein n=1 Tax=Nonomuraea sp. NPDC052265 TaxID=3364374 RepID=UPI0037CAF4B1
MRRNWAARLRHLTLDGLRAVTLENERLRVTVVPDKGGDVVEFLHKPTDTDFVWLSPQGLRDPRDHRHGAADDVAQFVDHYEGGWQEVFPNGGAPGEYRGARLAQHGEVAGLPWSCEVVADSEEEVAVRLGVRTRRLPYRVEKVFRLRSGTAALEVEGRVTNEADLALHAMWGQHIVFGAPFLRAGARIRLPEGVRVIPHAGPIDPAGRRVRPGGPWRWPVVPADGGGETDRASCRSGAGRATSSTSQVSLRVGTKFRGISVCGWSGMRRSSPTCGCGRSSGRPPATPGGDGPTRWGSNRSPACRPTAWPPPWPTGAPCRSDRRRPRC